MNIEKIKGLIAAPFTPMHADGEIKPDVVLSYANKLKKDGVIGAFICGTTGEGMLMTNEERKTISEEWIKQQTPGFKVIVHVGTTSAKQSNLLAQHAQQIGAYGIGSMGPMFLKPSGINQLLDFCAEVASGAPDLPFFYYHIPSVSGIDLPMLDFIRQARTQIPSFAGIKYTHNNLMEMQQCLQFDSGKWNIFHGFDEMLLAGLSFGATAAVGSTYNYMASVYQSLIKDFEMGNMDAARKKQSITVDIIESLFKSGGALVAGKTIMKLVGIDCGPCRLPLSNISAEAVMNLNEELKTKGFYELYH